MSDEVYKKLPDDLVRIIAHQQIRMDLIKGLTYELFELQDREKIDENIVKNLIAKTHSMLEEWLMAENSLSLKSIPHRIITTRATQIVKKILTTKKTSKTAVFIALNELALEFEQESEAEYGK